MHPDDIFIRKDPDPASYIFVLTLDRKKMKERVLIGLEEDIRKRLLGDKEAPVHVDALRPLGSLIINFENDPENTWYRIALHPLYAALHSNRWKQPGLEQIASSFLKEKFLSGDPVKMFASYKLWNDYLIARQPRDRDSASKVFLSLDLRLINAFERGKLLDYDAHSDSLVAIDPIQNIGFSAYQEDSRLELWYPDIHQPYECVSTSNSFRPLITYYLTRLHEWGFCFRTCKLCGKIFLAKNKRYDLCSEVCRKKQALQNKRDFDQRAKENNYDHQYKNESQNWRNQINRVKKNPSFPPERIEQIESVYADFRKEALRRKKLVKEKKTSPKEFSDWLYQQSSVIMKLCER